MKIAIPLFLLIFASLHFAIPAWAHQAECPLPGSDETSEDCPWAGLTRSIETASGDVWTALQPHDSDLTESIIKEATQVYLKDLWGESFNYDEVAQASIVSNKIIDTLITHFGVNPRNDRIVHSGLEHTYGYLLSNLKTPYGYKRARWVKNEIEKGFGLPKGTLSPNPPDGSFFTNVTAFIGKITYRDDGEIAHKLQTEVQGISAAIKNFNYIRLVPTRIREVLRMRVAPGKNELRHVVFRTDIVPFFRAPTSDDANSHLLIYSVQDSSKPRPLLLTAFPINRGFANLLMKRDTMGPDRPITTKYNAYVEGVTGVSPPLTGLREMK